MITIVNNNKGTVEIDSSLLQNLKDKFIKEFLKYLNEVEQGHIRDYKFLLNELSLINLLEDFNIYDTKIPFLLSHFLTTKFIIKRI